MANWFYIIAILVVGFTLFRIIFSSTCFPKIDASKRYYRKNVKKGPWEQ